MATFLGETNLLTCERSRAPMAIWSRFAWTAAMVCSARPGHRSPGTAPQATLSLRPEAVMLLAEHETADNVVDAEVLERVFLGQQVRYTLRALGPDRGGARRALA